MKPFSSFILVALALAGCAPSVVSSPASTGGTPVSGAPVSQAPPAVEPDEVLTVAPDNWWLLDREQNRVFGTSAERAYRELLGDRRPAREVVVAILDSGVDIEHEDLDDVLWVNEDEVAANGVDDDRNGYVDDVHGWSFLGGPGGDVHHDTYELTRLYDACRDRNAMDTPDCRELAAEFEERRGEITQLLQQYRQLDQAMRSYQAVLQAHLGTQSLTREAVEDIAPTTPELSRARAGYLQLFDMGATPEVLAGGLESLAGQADYGLNPDYDPRSIVGDNYADGNERIYGNNHVEGPAAEHGTHVAGIVAAERGNGIGVDGIAPSARIMVVRTVPDGDERDKDVANAIRYAVDNGAHIINMSFGKSHSPGKALVDDAVRYAESRGVLMVHAAGNDASDVENADNFPNRYYLNGGQSNLWIEVGASGWSSADSLAANFSNYGRTRVDVFAPGVAILSTIPGDEYERNQGTSMAAPVVSGLAALIMGYHPNLTAAQVREIILETATRYTSQSVVLPGGEGRRTFGEMSATGGIVNAYEALRRAAELSR